jgi:hypothetical protein
LQLRVQAIQRRRVLGMCYTSRDYRAEQEARRRREEARERQEAEDNRAERREKEEAPKKRDRELVRA